MSGRPSPRTRKLQALSSALGPGIAAGMDDDEVDEIMVNADGEIWLDRAGDGRRKAGARLDAGDLERAIRLLADLSGNTVHRLQPHLSGAMPDAAARFQAEVRPAVSAPVLTIRKLRRAVKTLTDLENEGVLSRRHHHAIAGALEGRLNILIAGATSSGKTTLANAMIVSEWVKNDRVIVIEDTPELNCASLDNVVLQSRGADPAISAQDLVKVALRLRPDRLIVGELRDHAAADVVKAWNTGHPGGLATLHANSARDAMVRLEGLILEGAGGPPRNALASAVDMVVFMCRTGGLRRVTEVGRMRGWVDGAWDIELIRD